MTSASPTYTGDWREKKLALLAKRLKRRIIARRNANGKRKRKS